MKFLAFKPLLQEIRLKNPTIRMIFLSSNVKALKYKKIHAAEACS